MKTSLHQFLRNFFLRTLWQTVLCIGFLMGAQMAFAQYQGYAQHRSPVDETIHNLQAIAGQNGVYSGHERERYDNALRHLSQFQDGLHHHVFDKGKLDQAIGDVQNVVDHNPMDARSKDMLWRDLARLRRMRADYDAGAYHW